MTPFEDRYKKDVKPIREIYGEENYLKLVFEVEKMFLIRYLCEFYPEINDKFDFGKIVYDYENIKNIEKKTKHDIVAVIKHIEQQIIVSHGCDGISKDIIISKIHYGLTSQDLVSFCNSILCKEAYLKITELTTEFKKMLFQMEDFELIGLTHGQKALPIRFSSVTASLIQRIVRHNKIIEPRSRFGGGTIGNNYSQEILFNLEKIEKIEKVCKRVSSIYGIRQITFHQQTDYYPSIVETMEAISSLSIVFEEFSKDMWSYISMNYFIQKNNVGECGSSTMSQKTNPINFENAEGNFYLSKQFSKTISEKLSTSRFERDLSDITVIRNIPLVFCYYVKGIKSLIKGMELVKPNKEMLTKEINNSYEMLAESVNLFLRDNNVADAYDISKNMFKERKDLTKNEYNKIIRESNLSEEIIKRLLKLTLN